MGWQIQGQWWKKIKKKKVEKMERRRYENIVKRPTTKAERMQ